MKKQSGTWMLSAAMMLVLFATAATAAAGAGSPLSKREKADLLYVKGLTEPGVPLTLDLSDPRQRRFLERQLDTAEVFRGSLRSQCLTLKTAHAVRKPRKKLTFLQMENPYDTWHPYGGITQFEKSGPSSYHSEAWLAVPDVIHATLTLQLFDTRDWNPIGGVAVVQDWFEEFVSIEADGRAEGPDVGAVFAYVYDAKDNLPTTAQVVFEQRGADIDPAFQNVNPSKQNDTADCNGSSPAVNPCVVICDQQQRSSVDCDYRNGLTERSTSREVPVSGTVSDFNPPLTTSPQAANVKMYIVDATDGACQVCLDGSIQTQQQPCPSTSVPACDPSNPPSICLSSGDNAVSWDFGNETFANSCLSSSNVAYFHLEFDVTTTGGTATVKVTSDSSPPDPCNATDDPSVTSLECKIPPLYFVFGCLPGGTPIRMADGSAKVIEEVAVGDQVRADESGRVLTVIDTIKGKEESPLVVVEHGDEKTLKLTETHPVVTERGVVLAKQLQAGYVLTTEDGPSEITAITREASDEKVDVFNLNLGSAEEEVTEDNTTMFAAGVLVGDNRMQGTYERRYETGGDAAHEVPPEWQRDYQRWLKKQKKEKKSGGR